MIRLYHCVSERSEAESILANGFRDKLLYPLEAPAPGSNPIGVELTDDPIIHYEHLGDEVLRVDLDVTHEELLPFEDRNTEGISGDFGPFKEDAWTSTRIPLVGTTRRDWVVRADWLQPHILEVSIVTESPEELWGEVARGRRPRPDAPQDLLNKRLAVLARTVHGRPFDGRWDYGERCEDKRPGTIAVQEGISVAHFERLIGRLIEWGVPLERCGWLLAEGARRVAVESLWIGKHLRQKRAAMWKSYDARAQDVPEVVNEAVRLAREGVPVAHVRRRLLARFGPDKVPSETVIRRRWLRYVRVPRP